MGTEIVKIQVVFATPARQVTIDMEVKSGTTIGLAVEESNIKAHFEKEDFSQVRYGIWNELKTLNEVVCDGDRVEIYRPLRQDPKDSRRRRAER